MKINTYKYSDKGPRYENQDALEVITFDNLFAACIADGVGGSNCGKLAASECVSFFTECLKNGMFDLEEIIRLAHNKIKDLQSSVLECKGMATTFTGCIIKENMLRGVHVGDSRLCILRENGLKQLSEDHTEAGRLVKAGKIKLEDVKNYPRKHVLESAVGANNPIIIQAFNFELLKDDRVLITSDGVHDVISKLEFRDLSKQSNNVNQFGESILNLLGQKKLTDNTSFIILYFE